MQAFALCPALSAAPWRLSSPGCLVPVGNRRDLYSAASRRRVILCESNFGSHNKVTQKSREQLQPQACIESESSNENTATQTQRASSISSLKESLFRELGNPLYEGVNRGLGIDADKETMDDQEANIEDAIEGLEDLNEIELPTKHEFMAGDWELIYTSSSITRYFGSVTGFHRLLPEGNVGKIVQTIDTEDGTSVFRERISFELPIFGNEMESDAVCYGKLRAASETRQTWEPEYVQFYFFKRFADGWKTLRAFQVADTTYLDEDIRITRGQTGNVNVFRKLSS